MLKKIIIVHIFIMTILTISSLSLSAQNVLPPNFSNIKVDDLSEAQVRKFLLQVDATGLDDSKIEQVARSRGMKPEEINKLKKRIETIRKSENIKNRSNKLFGNSNKDSSLKILDSTTLAEKALLELKGKIFGLDLFKSNKITFEPNLRIATPINYQIGPDDVLQLQLYGYSEVNYSLKVSSEGNITIPNIGVVSLLNNTIEQAKEKIKIKMSAIYAGLKTGKTSIYLTLDAIRSIKVIITGEVENPGTYTIPSVSTVFNALYFSGGPTENGTLREIELIRSGIKIASIDFYDFLIKGDLKNGLRLQDQDVILVSNYKNRVELIGEVKKPGIFEIKSGETLKDVISFSGGFTENAFNERIKVLRNTSSDRKIVDVLNYNLDQFIPQSGDKYYVDEILNRYQNRVTINGAVLRPGQYELDSGMTISELIKKAQGLREDAFLNIATINRTRDDLQQELINFDLLHDTTTMNLLLRKEDIVNISSIFDIKEEYNIKLIGQLIYGDTTLKYIEGMTLEDAIFKAGGLSDAASYKKISISRRVKNSNPFSTSANIAEVIEIELNENFKKSISNFKLKPFDIIIVRAVSGYEIQKNVKVEGEVLFPGLYTIQKKNETISSIIKRAGGLTSLAYPDGASLKRIYIDPVKDKKVDTIIDYSVNQARINDFVGIDLKNILEKPGSIQDLYLQEGDIILIPKQLQTISIKGQVFSPVTTAYVSNKSFKFYISSAGGFTPKANRKRSYVKYANGKTVSTKKFLFLNIYPKLKPGSEIFIPDNPNNTPLSITELVSVTSSILTLYLLITKL